MPTCWECNSDGPIHHHHVVPRSKGGTRTVPLCETCHGHVHDTKMDISALIRDGIKRAKAKGVRFGKKRYGDLPEEMGIRPRIFELRLSGLTLNEVSQRLKSEGYSARNGKAPSPQTILKVFNEEVEQARNAHAELMRKADLMKKRSPRLD